MVFGGDWNATHSILPTDTNPDVFSMRAVPSTARTRRILQLCENFGLSDPYRLLHPDARDFIYIPSGVLRRNRSRIDFFLISDTIFEGYLPVILLRHFAKMPSIINRFHSVLKKREKKVEFASTIEYCPTRY